MISSLIPVLRGQCLSQYHQLSFLHSVLYRLHCSVPLLRVHVSGLGLHLSPTLGSRLSFPRLLSPRIDPCSSSRTSTAVLAQLNCTIPVLPILRILLVSNPSIFGTPEPWPTVLPFFPRPSILTLSPNSLPCKLNQLLHQIWFWPRHPLTGVWFPVVSCNSIPDL